MNSFADFILWLRYTTKCASALFLSCIGTILVLYQSLSRGMDMALFIAALGLPLGALYYRYKRRVHFKDSGKVWCVTFLYIAIILYGAFSLGLRPAGEQLGVPVLAFILAAPISIVCLFPTVLFSSAPGSNDNAA